MLRTARCCARPTTGQRGIGRVLNELKKSNRNTFKDFRSLTEKKQVLNEFGNLYLPWMDKASALIASSTLLLEQCTLRKYSLQNRDEFESYADEIESGAIGSKVHIVILMLWAMAVEDLFKAMLLKSGEKLYENGEYQKAKGRNDHKLDKLANMISKKNLFIFSIDEMNLLQRLSSYIIIGRYPVPTRASEQENGMGWCIPVDDELYDNLVGKIWNVLIS
jgi:hypothetical protein